MSANGEFHYRLRRAAGGQRPGSHPASSLGAGHRFAGHARLFDVPDPRRIDLRASLRDVRRDWLVRTHLQRAATPVYAVVDVSASMDFGARVSKLERTAVFVEAMGNSAFRAGDPAGLIAFDAASPNVILMPPRHSRGIGSLMGSRLREERPRIPAARSGGGLMAAIEPLAGREGLVFIVSDFHWPLDRLGPALELLDRASVVPIVVWDRAEIEPPAAFGLLQLRDAENRGLRTLWVNAGLRQRWRTRIAQRREALAAIFLSRELRAFHLLDEFEPEKLSRYFLEEYV